MNGGSDRLCTQTALDGSRCTKIPGHRGDCDFGTIPTPQLVEAINWAVANDWARQSAEIGRLRDQVQHLQRKNEELNRNLEALREYRRTQEGR